MISEANLTPEGRAQLGLLGGAPFARLWDRVVALLEKRGLELGESTVGLSGPSEEERLAIAGLLGRPHSTGAVVRVRLADIDTRLRAGPLRVGLLEMLSLLGRSVRDRIAAETSVRRSIDAVIEQARGSSLATESWFANWLDGLVTDGTVRKLVGEGSSGLIGVAITLFEALPADGLPLPVLAARITGTTKGLEPGVLSTIILRGLALRAGVPKPKRAAERRALWESFGVVADDLSSNVLVLNLPASGRSRLDEWLRGATMDGVPLRLTLHQLATYRLQMRPAHVWLCENPAVVRAAAQRFGAASAPLVCTEGHPSTAFDLLLDTLARDGCEFSYHGDFDWPGIRIAASVRGRHGAAIWRMGAVDYEAAIAKLDASELPELEGEAVSTPWDPDLGMAMGRASRAVFEEMVVDALLADLSTIRTPRPSGRARTSIGELMALQRCAHRVHLDRDGDVERRLPTNSFLEMLWGDTVQRDEAVLRGREVARVDQAAPADARRRQTSELMHAGVQLIADAYLEIGDLVGRVPLLVKSEQTSGLGDYSYVPGIVRQRTLDEEPDARDALALCGYAELLESAQDGKPSVGIVIAQDGGEVRVDLEAFKPRYRELRRRMRRILLGVESTRPGLKNECRMCHWHTLCHEALVAADDVTLVPGLGESERDRLHDIDVRSRASLASVSAETLEGSGIGKRRASSMIRAARVQRSGVPEVLAQWKRPSVDVEIAYDIEDAILGSFVYLHGLLQRRAGDVEPRSVCARLPETEGEVWSRFAEQLRRLDSIGSYYVYVYGAHERTTLRRLARRYGDSQLVDAFVDRFIDVHEAVRNSIVLPVESYGLKSVARSFGFDWRDDDAGGVQSMVWWAAYAEDPVANAAARERILTYNEDDLRATLAVVDWLEQATARRTF